MMKRTVLLLTGLLSFGLAHAQRGSKPEVSSTIKGDLQLPIPFKNPFFTGYTENIGQVGLTYQYPVYKGLGIGAGGGMWWSSLKQRALQPFVPAGDVRRAIAFGKVQFEQYTGAVTYHEASVKLGAAWYDFDCGTCSGAGAAALYWAIGWGYFVHATENLSFGFTIGYDNASRTFSAKDLGLERFPDRLDRAESRPAQNVLLGLSFSTRLRRSEREAITW